MSAPKIFLIAFYLIGLAVGIFGGSSIALLVVGLTLAAHVLEFVVFRGVFRQDGGSMGEHFGQTLLFGFFHIKDVKERVEAGTS